MRFRCSACGGGYQRTRAALEEGDEEKKAHRLTDGGSQGASSRMGLRMVRRRWEGILVVGAGCEGRLVVQGGGEELSA